jgi:hypothetical protein
MPKISKVRTTLYDATFVLLAGNAVWTAAGRRCNDFRYIRGTIFADVAGILYVEQDADNLSFAIQDTFAVAAGVGLGFKALCVGRFIRLRYVNGAAAQAVFRLWSELEP